MVSFPQLKDGMDVEYAKYYRDRYQMKVTDQNQPMLVSKPKMADQRRGNDQPIILVPEFCNMTGLSEEQRANFKLMQVTQPKKKCFYLYWIGLELCWYVDIFLTKYLLCFQALGEYTRTVPEKRVEALLKYANRMNKEPKVQQEFERWGLKFSTELERFESRCLQPEVIRLGSGRECTYSIDNADWGSAFRYVVLSMVVKLSPSVQAFTYLPTTAF